MPKVVSAKPPPIAQPPVTAATPCAGRLSESSCKEGTRCRWVNDYKRADGTWATSHCSAPEQRRKAPQ